MTTKDDKPTIQYQHDPCIPAMGTCYDLDDARRALRDRPSMERELDRLRAYKQHQDYKLAKMMAIKRVEDIEAERDRLREEVGALRKYNQRLLSIIALIPVKDREERDRLRVEVEHWQERAKNAEIENAQYHKSESEEIEEMAEMQSLREEVERLRAALREISGAEWRRHGDLGCGCCHDMGRIARKALNEGGGDGHGAL